MKQLAWGSQSHIPGLSRESSEVAVTMKTRMLCLHISLPSLSYRLVKTVEVLDWGDDSVDKAFTAQV